MQKKCRNSRAIKIDPDKINNQMKNKTLLQLDPFYYVNKVE